MQKTCWWLVGCFAVSKDGAGRHKGTVSCDIERHQNARGVSEGGQDQVLKVAHWSIEGCLPLVSFMDADEIVGIVLRRQ